jgi:predicted nucleic acid-binding protein
MTLVDTSIWVNHLRRPHPGLIELLEERAAGIHPFVIGEIACGNLKNRSFTLEALERLPQARIARESEVRHLLESNRFWGTGLGWVDLHLLAAARLAGWELITADKVMARAAEKLGIAG